MRSQEKSRPGETGRYNTATVADFNGNISLKNISPRREGEIKNLSQQREEISRASDGGANVVPSSTNSDSYVGGAPVSAGRSSDGANIAQEAQNVNEDVRYKLNPEHEAQVRAYNEHITRLRQREEYLRGQGISENAPVMINLRKAQEQAIYARNHIGETDENGLKYKLDDQMQELTSQNNLLARHLQLTGDENLVFNEWQNEMQKKALGYYDPKTDQINLNKLTEDTLNHELGHKLLTRVENKQDLLNAIRESYGDEYLINKYGSQYGNDLNLLAEEQLADGFSDYYKGRLNGEDKVRLGARLGIPQKILAIYDRITEAVMGLVGKQDAIKQFYAQMETGKFRTKQQVPGGDGQIRTMSIDPERALNAIKGIDDLANSRRALFTLARVSDNLANRIKTDTGISINKDARIVMDRDGAVHMLSTHGQGGKKPANPLTDADLGRLPYVLEDPDVIIKGKPVRNTERIRMERNLEGNKIAIVEVIKKGNELRVVTYFNDSSSGRTNPANNMSRLDDTSETGQLQSTNLNDTIANNAQDVNTDNRYQHPLQETINEMEANPKPKMTRELRDAIDEFIYENIDPNLFNNAIVLELSVEMDGGHTLLVEELAHTTVE